MAIREEDLELSRSFTGKKNTKAEERGGYKLLILDVQRYFYSKYNINISKYLSELIANELWKTAPQRLYTLEYKAQKKGYSKQAPDIIWEIQGVDLEIREIVNDLKKLILEFSYLVKVMSKL